MLLRVLDTPGEKIVQVIFTKIHTLLETSEDLRNQTERQMSRCEIMENWKGRTASGTEGND